MSVQPIFKLNETESAFIEAFRDRFGSLPGADDAAFGALRNQAMARFEAAGLPHRRLEDWKYTDLRRLITTAGVPSDTGSAPDARSPLLEAFGPLEPYVLAFVNGVIAPDVSEKRELPGGVSVSCLSEGFDDWVLHEIETRRPEGGNAVFDLNTALMQDSAIIDVAAGTVVDRPIVIADLADAGTASHLRHVVRVGENARLTLILVVADANSDTDPDEGIQSSALSLLIGDGADVTLVKIQDLNRSMVHLAPHVVEIGAQVKLNAFTLSLGAGVSREERHVTFAGEGADGSVSGAYIIDGKQHADTTLVVDHVEPGCASREQFRAVVDDEANGVFQGLLRVAQKAQKTDARQSVDSLLLSDLAQHNSKPELEIYADDVQCAHGATNGELDEDALFYLRARGVPLVEAERILIDAFVSEGLETLDEGPLRDILTGLAQARLAKREGSTPDA